MPSACGRPAVTASAASACCKGPAAPIHIITLPRSLSRVAWSCWRSTICRSWGRWRCPHARWVRENAEIRWRRQARRARRSACLWRCYSRRWSWTTEWYPTLTGRRRCILSFWSLRSESGETARRTASGFLRF
ncbi:hypothetical protein SDC9_124152 [bioreactor metagenome]|uniref:Uncharacterized protein n=1 Tax=bioreactor metagenome TaxID=1076179 RepID=A0A645CK65_9ZZZZ